MEAVQSSPICVNLSAHLSRGNAQAVLVYRDYVVEQKQHTCTSSSVELIKLKSANKMLNVKVPQPVNQFIVRRIPITHQLFTVQGIC